MLGARDQKRESPSHARLGDLSIWLVGSPDLARATNHVSQVVEPAPRDDWQTLLHNGRPDFLLVEGVADLPQPWAARIDELLDLCERERIPRLLWITGSRFDRRLRPLHRFTRMFSLDHDHLQPLRAAGDEGASLLWPGTTLEATGRSPGREQRTEDVVWLGEWRSDWPEDWRRRVAAILEAARPYGLRIAGPVDPAALPERLRPCVDPVRPADVSLLLGNAKVAIATDRAGSTPRFAPKSAFDAMARGAAVVTPHRFAAVFDFSIGARQQSSWRDLIRVAEDGDTAGQEIDQLLNNEAVWTETVEICRRITRNNHTYGHRIATLASAAGIRVIPDAIADPAHS